MALTNFVKNIRNIMRNDAGINGDAQRIEQIAWMLFLKVYDEKENDWEFNEDDYQSFIPEDCRWRNWAHDEEDGEALTADKLLDFVDNTLFPTLKGLEVTPETPMRSAIVRTTFENANQYMKDGVLLRQVLNVIDELDLSSYEDSHAFGEIYESILKEMQSAGTAGEFYTPRALTDFMAEIIQPKVGEKMADFACGTGGFLTSWLKALDKKVVTAEDREAYATSIYGIEKKQFPYMLCVTNMLLHNIESPKVMHDNSLTKDVLNYTDDDKFDVILMNPPYGGNEKADVKRHFPSDLSSSETADLFMVVIMYRLAKNGRAAVILPDGFLFGTDGAKLAIKEKLLREFNLHTIIRLPGSIFAPYTSIATNILFFDNIRAEGAKEGFSTNETWFYRLDMPEGYKHFSKTKPMKSEHCQPIRDWWEHRVEIVDDETGEEKSRSFTPQELIDTGFNFDQCKFPKEEEEVLRPEELLTQYHKLKDTLNDEIENLVLNFESVLNNEAPKNITLTIKNPCNVLSELISNIPERLKKSILQEAIEGRLVPQDPNDEPASALLDKIRAEKKRLLKEGKLKKKDLEETPISEDEILFIIPKSWEWCRLKDICIFLSRGKSPAYSDVPTEYPVFAQKCNLKDGGISLEQARFLSVETISKWPEEYHLRTDDVLVNSTGTGTVCRTRLFHESCLGNYPFTVPDSHVSVVRTSDCIYSAFIFYLFNSKNYQDYWEDRLAGSTNQKELYIGVLQNTIIPVPPLAEQKRIVEKIEQLLGEIDKLKK